MIFTHPFSHITFFVFLIYFPQPKSLRNQKMQSQVAKKCCKKKSQTLWSHVMLWVATGSTEALISPTHTHTDAVDTWPLWFVNEVLVISLRPLRFFLTVMWTPLTPRPSAHCPQSLMGPLSPLVCTFSSFNHSETLSSDLWPPAGVEPQLSLITLFAGLLNERHCISQSFSCRLCWCLWYL